MQEQRTDAQVQQANADSDRYKFCSVEIVNGVAKNYIIVSCDGKILRSDDIDKIYSRSTFTREIGKLLKDDAQLKVLSCSLPDQENERARICFITAQ